MKPLLPIMSTITKKKNKKATTQKNDFCLQCVICVSSLTPVNNLQWDFSPKSVTAFGALCSSWALRFLFFDFHAWYTFSLRWNSSRHAASNSISTWIMWKESWKEIQRELHSVQIYGWKLIKAFLPQDVLMTSRNSAYFHLLSSYFLTSAWAFVAVTCGALNPWKQHKQNQNEGKKCGFIFLH